MPPVVVPGVARKAGFDATGMPSAAAESDEDQREASVLLLDLRPRVSNPQSLITGLPLPPSQVQYRT